MRLFLYERIRDKAHGAWNGLKLMLVVIFAMVAGVAVHHQYIMQTEAMPSEPVLIYLCEVAPEKTVSEKMMAEPPPERGEPLPEEAEWEAAADELELLAICVEAEAGNQSLTGKRMVADVILNRVDDRDFPDIIEGVISQKNAFTSFWDGGMDRVVEPSEETIRAVQMELEKRSWPGLFYFTAEGWPAYGTPWKQVGDHYFSTK